MTDLRDKIARALAESMADLELGPLSDSSIVETEYREQDMSLELFESYDDELPLLSIDLGQLAGDMLAVIDLDKIRAEAFEAGVRSAVDAVNSTPPSNLKPYLRGAEQ